MNYQEALSYLYSLSDFERGGTYMRDPEENIMREARLLAALGNPQQNYGSTLIAGTKGKGSTAALIERVLRQTGRGIGLYTQPDLHTFRERIRVNGQLILEQEVADLLTEIRTVAEHIQNLGQSSPFITYEIATALALLYYSRKSVEHAVLEVGLGGRLDATNVVQPLVSVITSISYDHMQILGNTLTEIATEKAGIIKPDGIVVTSAQFPEALIAIANVCRKQQARMIRVGAFQHDTAQREVETGLLPALSYTYQLERETEGYQYFSIQTPDHTYTHLELPLMGLHQLENATVALATLSTLRERGIEWNEADLRNGFRSVHWPARMEVIGRWPTIVVDGAHNADSMQKLMQALHTSFSWHHLIVVLSIARDKDLEGIIEALKDADRVVLTRMNNPRVASIEQLKALFGKYAPQVQIYVVEKSNEAMELALGIAEKADLICATGSLYLAGEVLRWSAAQGNAVVAEEIEGVDH
ncbi:MAG: bifunctional folylpolyglutamate synthase/dihydrofolate synthase [Chloroflexota bacterium]|nr:bifunctional folylpolyglutamate synthase/dihydrofolate synthase [Chloroflexota bacterium]